MRQKRKHQMTIFHAAFKKDIGKELKVMSQILDETPRILNQVFKDLIGTNKSDLGRMGLTAEQVLRCAILKQHRDLTYEELAFHLEDSQSFRAFSRLEMGQYPSGSTLQENIKALKEETWEHINQLITGYAREEGLEKGKKVRSGLDGSGKQYSLPHRCHASSRWNPGDYAIAAGWLSVDSQTGLPFFGSQSGCEEASA